MWRRYRRSSYAFCVLDQPRVGLRRRDVYVPGSTRWGDPRAELLPPDTWDQHRDQACEDLPLDTDRNHVVSNLGTALDVAWRGAAEGMATNPDLRIEHRDGADRVVVTPLDVIDEPASLIRLRAQIEALLPEIEIADMPLEVHGWTGFLDECTHISGAPSRASGLAESVSALLVADASEIVFALAWTLGYRDGPRLADHRLWRINTTSDYGPLQGLARNRINTALVVSQWDQICRLTASLEARTVTPSAILRSLQRGPNPSSLGRALAVLGRVIKTLHVLDYCHDPVYRRAIHRILNRGESRNSLARDIFHGRRGQLRQHYQTGQEDQLGALGLMVNIIVLWQAVYIQAALDHLAAHGHNIDPDDVARLSPIGHPTINLHGCYRTTSRPPNGGLRPLRAAEQHG